MDFKAGETIYKQGTESKYLVFLLSGMAKIYVEGDNGKTFILELIKPFQFLDIPAIFEDDMLYVSEGTGGFEVIKFEKNRLLPLEILSVIFLDKIS